MIYTGLYNETKDTTLQIYKFSKVYEIEFKLLGIHPWSSTTDSHHPTITQTRSILLYVPALCTCGARSIVGPDVPLGPATADSLAR
jgi:hypothetical protein